MRWPDLLLTALIGTSACVPACKSKDAAPGLNAQAASADPSAAGANPPGSAASAEPGAPPIVMTGPPLVDLAGVATVPASPAESTPRLAAIALRTDVRARPDPGSTRLGDLRAGAVVEMDPDVTGTAGCPGGWRQIKPAGHVCIGSDATLDLGHPIVRASSRRPDITQKLPYMYGTVTRGGPAYLRIPTEADIKQFEPSLKKHLAKWAKDTQSGATYGLDVWLKWKQSPAPPALDALENRTTDQDIPDFLKNGGTLPVLPGTEKPSGTVKAGEVSRRNGVAFVDSFLFEGRRYNVTTDLRIAPADRFRPIRGSDFHGYRIGIDIDFPFALVRRQGAKRWVYSSAKNRLVAAGDLAWRSAVALTGKQKFFNGKLHYETKDGDYVDDRHAGRVDPAKKMPAWGKNGEKWIDINITKQVLVAYEGTRPVYATLVSSGEAGLDDPEKTKSTRRGIFRIHTKYITTTMDSDAVGEEFELRDVPYVQYFEDGYALHGAYWHDMFGQPKSHGCVNLSPEDARRLFFWTDPPVPAGWHGAARSLTGTVVFIHP